MIRERCPFCRFASLDEHVLGPDAEAGVLVGRRFAAKLIPHGPANAVLVASPDDIDGSRDAGGAAAAASGWPARKRDTSGSGPRGPILIGV